MSKELFPWVPGVEEMRAAWARGPFSEQRFLAARSTGW